MDSHTASIVAEVQNAWNDAGPFPPLHYDMQRELRSQWPVLAEAVERLAQLGHRGEWDVPIGPIDPRIASMHHYAAPAGTFDHTDTPTPCRQLDLTDGTTVREYEHSEGVWVEYERVTR